MFFLVVAVFGLVLGSFATAIAHRVPLNIPWHGLRRPATNNHGVLPADTRRSACPHCGHVLDARDLVPVFSWLLQRGRCRFCRAPLSLSYPLTELLVMLACLGIYTVHGLSVTGVLLIMAMPFLAALMIIDMRSMILPNPLVAIIFLLGLLRLAGLIYASDQPYNLSSFLDLAAEYGGGAVLFTVLAWVLGHGVTLLLKKQALGFGDVKFFAAAGLWLGLGNLSWFCIFSGVAGVLLGFFWKIFTQKDIFPFGPALIVSFYFLLILHPY